MNVILIAAGALLVIAAMLDAFRTTLGFGGSGPITGRLTSGMWRLVLSVHRGRGGRSHGLLRGAGSVILLTTVAIWIAMVFAGYLLMFAAEPGAIVHSSTGAAADWGQRFYFTGYTLFTLGIGDFVPASNGWRVATVVATLNGLFLVTLAITYLIPVISAATQQQQLAAMVSNLGSDPQEIIARAWDGKGFAGLGDHLVQISSMIDLHGQRHLSYPVLHYFHSVERRTAVAPSLATLDEALSILSNAVQKEHRLPPSHVEPVRQALHGLLEILRSNHVREHNTASPPPPDLSRVRAAGIPLVRESEFHEAVAAEQTRRRLLKAYVEDDGWSWDAVAGS